MDRITSQESITDINTVEKAVSLLSEDDYLEMIRKLRVDLYDRNSEYEILKSNLKDRDNEVETLTQELNECRLTMIENDRDQLKSQAQVNKTKDLEEDYVKLMNDFLTLGESFDHYRQDVIDKYITKTNVITHLECLMSSGSIQKDLKDTKTDLDDALAGLNLASAKIRNLEEEVCQKDKRLNHLRKALDDAKITHKHEITVHEEYIQSLKNTVESYEKTLLNYIKPEPHTDADVMNQ